MTDRISAVFIDMDDTLIVNQALYSEAFSELKGYLRVFGATPDQITPVFAEIEKKNFAAMGYSRKRYPQSFEDTLMHFVPSAGSNMVEAVRAFAENVFTTIAPMKPGTLEAIEMLTEKFPVYLVTQGDTSVQEGRVAHLPFKDKLAGVFIVESKTEQTFRELTQTLGLNPSETVMIGDSLKSDIVTSTAAGLRAAWIEATNASFEKADLPSKNVFKFSSLLELARELTATGTITDPSTHFKKPSGPHQSIH